LVINHLGGWASFVVFGLVSEIAAVLFFLYLFRRRGWV